MQVQERDDAVVVVLRNDQCAQLWKTIEPYIERGHTRFVFDLGGVTFLNSVSIAGIITVRNKIVANSGRVALANLSLNVKSVFRILKLERLFDLDMDTDSATRCVSG